MEKDVDVISVCIATGIYPPELGGPAEYAKNLADIWKKRGYGVHVEVFSRFNSLPTGIRHIVYSMALLKSVWKSDFVFILDTFSAALPATVVAKLLGKKTILRTGGDFLWEGYVERTGDLTLLKDFYNTCLPNLSFKERIVFRIIKFILNTVDVVVWSTLWQKNIFMQPYELQGRKHKIIENYYGEKFAPTEAQNKNFVAGTRVLKWKNIPVLEEVFVDGEVVLSGAQLDLERVTHDAFLEKIKQSYAVIISSLGDISPNTILDAIRCDKPFIVTKETGLYDRIKPIALFVDPKSIKDIREKVLWLANDKNYEIQCKKVQDFTFTHTWEEIAHETPCYYSNNKYQRHNTWFLSWVG
jgi:glycosyltransferase involved in cell wall biosynthesis